MIVVGIDGANRETIIEPARRGGLENIGRLLSDGVGGDCWSVTTSSAAAWTAHLTGLTPDESGITGFTMDDRFVRTDDIAVRTYPELLNEDGYEVGLLNFPITYPELNLENGFCVPGQLTPVGTEVPVDDERVREILDDVDYEVDVQYGDRQYSFVDADLEVSAEELRDDVLRIERKRLAAAKRALELENWDLFFVQVNGTDPMQHFLWDEIIDSPLEETGMYPVYEIIDDFIGHVIDNHEDEPVLIFSDHGFRSDVWGTDEDTRARWSSLRSLGSRLLPERLKQTRLRQIGLNVLAKGAAVSSSTDDSRPPGCHDPAGIWAFGGDAVESRDEEVESQFLDLPATILHMMDHPVPTAYPGAVRTDVLKDERSERREEIDLSIDRTGDDITAETAEQLANLGYVEMVEGDGSDH